MSLAPTVAYCRLKILQDISVNMQFKSTDSELNQRSCNIAETDVALYTITHIWARKMDMNSSTAHFFHKITLFNAKAETLPTSTSLKLPADTPIDIKAQKRSEVRFVPA